MVKAKAKIDVVGYRDGCLNYRHCPICYGCRNYDPSSIRCETHCKKYQKQNVCNTYKHRADMIDKLVFKDTINI